MPSLKKINNIIFLIVKNPLWGNRAKFLAYSTFTIRYSKK